MAFDSEKDYAVGGNKSSDQAEPSTANRGAGTLQMRILIELQVISYLLNQELGATQEDLTQLRQDLADEIT
jgi:hypothetical protein